MTDGLHDEVALDVFTSAGLFHGRLRIPRGTTLLEHLNRAGEHLRLADAHVGGAPLGIPFLAVRRDSVRLIVPAEAHAAEVLAPKATDGTGTEVAGVMDACRFRGRVRLAPGQRVTDFFASAPAFVAVRDCNASRVGDPDGKPIHSAVALVRTHAVIAFSDTLE